MRVNIVIDVEMCPVQKKLYRNRFPYSNEIIQIGAVMMNENYEIVDEFSSFVRPDYGKINFFIENLTGISERDVRFAPSLERVLHKMLEWIGDREAEFFSWSETDYYQIRGEILSKAVNTDGMGFFLEADNWIDYQKKVMKRFDLCRAVSLTEALSLTDLYPEGRLHDGLADAYNTARIIAGIEKDPRRQFAFELACRKEESFGFSLGDLLKGIIPETA